MCGGVGGIPPSIHTSSIASKPLKQNQTVEEIENEQMVRGDDMALCEHDVPVHTLLHTIYIGTAGSTGFAKLDTRSVNIPLDYVR